MIYFKPNFADGSIGDAQDTPSMTMVGNGGCIIEDAPTERGVLSVELTQPNEPTPAFETLFPVYESDFTPSELADAKYFNCTATSWATTNAVITPTENMYIIAGMNGEYVSSEMGAPVTAPVLNENSGEVFLVFYATDANSLDDATIILPISIGVTY